MTRFWNEFVDILSGGSSAGVAFLAFLSLLATTLFALAWYFWPRWLPWNWNIGRHSSDPESSTSQQSGTWRFRFGSLRWRWRLRRRRKRGARAEDRVDLPPDELPDLPADALTLTADQFAAAGRFREAVRERLRAIVRDLVERDVIPFSPGWTVTELAGAAVAAVPALAPPLRAAVGVFSEIWYGLRPAHAGDDLAMREHADAVKRLLAESSPAPVSQGAPAGGGR